MKLLIVDDSEIIREAIGEWISELDIEIVGQAGDGKKAIELVKSLKPDIVTLDITMPEIDGLTAMDEILKIYPETKVIIISALSAKEIALSALKKGAVSYVVKPFTKDELIEVIKEVKEG